MNDLRRALAPSLGPVTVTSRPRLGRRLPQEPDGTARRDSRSSGWRSCARSAARKAYAAIHNAP